MSTALNPPIPPQRSAARQGPAGHGPTNPTKAAQPPGGFPIIFNPEAGNADLLASLVVRREEIAQTLLKHGAILFRGYELGQLADLEIAATIVGGAPMAYRERATKRSAVEGNIVTSTDTPRRYVIPMHNESSYAATWPLHVMFYCDTPARSGGHTPLADSRRVFQRIAPEIRQRFAQRGVLYVRNFGVGPGMGWRDAFQVQTRDELETYCGQAGIEYEWVSDVHLRTRQHCRCDAVHPRTGEPVWFCHATVLHVSSLDPALRETLLRQYDEKDLPHNAYYGDGSPIDPQVLDHIRMAYDAEVRRFNWHKGDLLLLDNMLVAHGRDPYEGVRKILALLASPTTWAEVDRALKQDAGAATCPRIADSQAAVDATSTPDREPAGRGDQLDALLLATLAEVLEVSVVHMEDNFFDLGGDSLTATRAINKIREHTNIDLSLASFFNVYRVRELADLVRDAAALNDTPRT